jgi:putative DNA primase/helicase
MKLENLELPANVHAEQTWLPPGYIEQQEGIFFQPKQGEHPIFVCSPLSVVAVFADDESKGWGRLVTLTDLAGVDHTIPILSETLDGSQQRVIGQLASHGLIVGNDPKSRRLLLDLLKTANPNKRLISVQRPGWVGHEFQTFSLGQSSVGQGTVLPLYDAASHQQSALFTEGTLESWRSQIGEKCRGNPMMLLAVSLAFSAPLLRLLGMEGGGLHFRGQSSSGKTTLLRLAASVWGAPGLINQWRATSNGLEALAVHHNDLLLPLDEIGEIEPAQLDQAVYLLSHGKPKLRMSKELGLAHAANWIVTLISSGELSVRTHLASARIPIREGQEVRLLDIEADTREHGVFDDLHGAASAGQFARAIQAAAAANFGAVGRAFLEAIIKFASSKRSRSALQQGHEEFERTIIARLAARPDNMAGRVAKRFALIAIAGEVATSIGLTGWDKGEAKEAVIEAFVDWHDRWIGEGADVAAGTLRKLSGFLTAHGGEIVDIRTYAADQTKLGFRHAGRVYFPATSWRTIFPAATGVEAARELAACRVLVPGEGSHLQKRGPCDIPRRPRFYTIDLDRLKSLLPD